MGPTSKGRGREGTGEEKGRAREGRGGEGEREGGRGGSRHTNPHLLPAPMTAKAAHAGQRAEYITAIMYLRGWTTSNLTSGNGALRSQSHANLCRNKLPVDVDRQSLRQ